MFILMFIPQCYVLHLLQFFFYWFELSTNTLGHFRLVACVWHKQLFSVKRDGKWSRMESQLASVCKHHTITTNTLLIPKVDRCILEWHSYYIKIKRKPKSENSKEWGKAARKLCPRPLCFIKKKQSFVRTHATRRNFRKWPRPPTILSIVVIDWNTTVVQYIAKYDEESRRPKAVEGFHRREIRDPSSNGIWNFESL